MSNYLLDSADHGAESELFVVEGKSAQQAVNQVRNRKIQAVFAMQGKPPNVHRRNAASILEHPQCRALFDVLGCGTGDDCNPTRLHYGRVLLLADGDIDGHHCNSLLLSLFAHYLRPLVLQGYLRVISAPRYRMGLPGMNEEKIDSAIYLWTAEEKQQHNFNQPSTNTASLTYFKGVASLSSNELYRLLIDRRTRRETPVLIDTTSDEKNTTTPP